MQPYQPMGPGGSPGSGPGPGQPGPHLHPYYYPPSPPSAPRTLGTLSIVFGAIVVAQSVFGIVGGGAMLGLMRGLRGVGVGGVTSMEGYLRAIQLPSLIQSLVFLLMSVWLILIGVGQRRYRAWAARQSVIWGVAGLVVLVGVVALYFAVIGPATAEMMEGMSRFSGRHNPMGPFMRWAGLFGVVFHAPYPIILIATFRKPSIVSAMTT